MTSSFIAEIALEKCLGCGKCAKACPVDNIVMQDAPRITAGDGPRKKKEPHLDPAACLGCGVCALACETGALRLIKRRQRVFHPETLFEKQVLAALERGNLQNYIFADPQRASHKLLRGLVGAFCKAEPVKRALLSGFFRSSFLAAMRTGARLQGKGQALGL